MKDAGYQRFEASPVVGGPRRRHGEEGAAVEALLESDDLEAVIVAVAMPAPRQLERRLVGLANEGGHVVVPEAVTDVQGHI